MRSEFTHVVLNEDGQSKATLLRIRFTSLLDEVEELCGSSREAALVRTKLQEACFWALKAVSSQPVNQALPTVVPVLLLFLALPAFAADVEAAPESTNWLAWVVSAFFAALTPVLKVAFDALRVSVKGKFYQNAIYDVTNLMETKAAWLHLRLASAASDGKITRQELEIIAKDLLADLPTDTVNILQERMGGAGLLTWAMGLLMDAWTVRRKDMAEADAAVASARIADAEAAKAVWKAAAQ